MIQSKEIEAFPAVVEVVRSIARLGLVHLVQILNFLFSLLNLLIDTVDVLRELLFLVLVRIGHTLTASPTTCRCRLSTSCEKRSY